MNLFITKCAIALASGALSTVLKYRVSDNGL